MLDDLIVEPMKEDFILWRCLHAGPLTRRNIDAPEPNVEVDWPSTRARNIPLLKKLTRTYGACAILARKTTWPPASSRRGLPAVEGNP